ncbi:hypothetical protein F5B20DRAFT_235634 [Whalleya microplaca]|nr:hypothetical protein F5B20DRAFT_235634 [Whalleya microplaca]
MRTQKTLRKALKMQEGLTFQSEVQLFKDPDDVFKAIVSLEFELTPEEARKNIANRVSNVFDVCVRNEDTYRRFRGSNAFFHLIAAEWNPVHPLTPGRIEELVSLFVGARRRYLSQLGESDESVEKANQDSVELDQSSAKLIGFLDRFIEIEDDVGSTRPTRRTLSLAAPKDVNLSQQLANTSLGARVWPPAHFSNLDVAIIGETTVRKQLFGVDFKNRLDEDDEPRYPHDGDVPLDVRNFLCWLSLTEKHPTSKCSLFLAPVAFIDHKQRQDWHITTGHKSRFYATTDEFLNYAHDEFDKTGPAAKTHVLALLTPWFFEIDAVRKDAEAKDQPIPIVWQKTCFRAGMMILLMKVKKNAQRRTYRLILFKPGLPVYPGAAEPKERREKQDAWIKKLREQVDARFDVVEGWIGGAAVNHEKPPASRGVSADSVESSSEIIMEIMKDVGSLPSSAKEFLKRHFKAMEGY